MRRSRPSFSELAPVLPRPWNQLESTPAVTQVEPPRSSPPPIPFEPSVIISDDPLLASPPPPRAIQPAIPTSRRARLRFTTRGRGGSLATVLVLLCLSIAIFGIGIAALVFTKSTKSAHAAPPAKPLVFAKH